MSDFLAVPAITVLCYLAAELYKTLLNQRLHRHIPAFCALLGALLGAACHLWLPGFLDVENLLVAAAMGTVSGWAATGANQTIKQESTA